MKNNSLCFIITNDDWCFILHQINFNYNILSNKTNYYLDIKELESSNRSKITHNSSKVSSAKGIENKTNKCWDKWTIF